MAGRGFRLRSIPQLQLNKESITLEVILLGRRPFVRWTHPWVVKPPTNTVLESANVAPSESHEHQSGVKSTARRSHSPSMEQTDRQGQQRFIPWTCCCRPIEATEKWRS